MVLYSVLPSIGSPHWLNTRRLLAIARIGSHRRTASRLRLLALARLWPPHLAAGLTKAARDGGHPRCLGTCLLCIYIEPTPPLCFLPFVSLLSSASSQLSYPSFLFSFPPRVFPCFFGAGLLLLLNSFVSNPVNTLHKQTPKLPVSFRDDILTTLSLQFHNHHLNNRIRGFHLLNNALRSKSITFENKHPQLIS